MSSFRRHSTGGAVGIIAILILRGLGLAASSDPGLDHEEFVEELRKPIAITQRIAPQLPDTRSLSTEDRSDLLAAKEAMARFLKSFKDPDRDPLTFLSKSLRSTYKSRRDLWAREFGAESLLEVEVYDFVLGKKVSGDVVLYVVITDTTEGIDSRYQSAFQFQQEDGQWVIAAFSKEVGFR